MDDSTAEQLVEIEVSATESQWNGLLAKHHLRAIGVASRVRLPKHMDSSGLYIDDPVFDYFSFSIERGLLNKIILQTTVSNLNCQHDISGFGMPISIPTCSKPY